MESPVVEEVTAAAYRVPTAGPEADGTLRWDATTPVVRGRPVADVPARWLAMRRRIRNLGPPGLVSCAMSAADTALWDLAAPDRRPAARPAARARARRRPPLRQRRVSPPTTTRG